VWETAPFGDRSSIEGTSNAATTSVQHVGVDHGGADVLWPSNSWMVRMS
jgi:hypothetical protein